MPLLRLGTWMTTLVLLEVQLVWMENTTMPCIILSSWKMNSLGTKNNEETHG